MGQEIYVGSVTLPCLAPGIRLNLALSLHNQGVVEQEHVSLVVVETKELVSPLMDSLSSTGSEVHIHWLLCIIITKYGSTLYIGMAMV